jgi:hypothetical protein
MPPLAPVVTQTVATDLTPCPAGTVLADIAQPPEEVDPGPFTYSCGPAPPGNLSVAGTTLVASDDLEGSNWADVVATSAGGDSPATRATITVAEAVDMGTPFPTDDPYLDNPQLPPPTPADERWRAFLRRAIIDLVPRARFGVDFMVAREAGKNSGQVVLDWDDTLLGPYPQAEVEAHAQALADAQPWSEPPPP